MANTKQNKQEKKISLSEMAEEIKQLTDLAQAINARCFYLREELKLKNKQVNKTLKNQQNGTT